MNVFSGVIDIVNKDTVSHPVTIKEKPVVIKSFHDDNNDVEEEIEEPKKEEIEVFEQISIFDDLDD